MKNWLALMAISVAMAVSGNALAHGAKPKHGGIVREANDVQFELVEKNGQITIYVEDHDKALLTAGASGKLTILNGAEKTELPLQPAGENKLEAKGEAVWKKGSKAVAMITLVNQRLFSVRFAAK